MCGCTHRSQQADADGRASATTMRVVHIENFRAKILMRQDLLARGVKESQLKLALRRAGDCIDCARARTWPGATGTRPMRKSDTCSRFSLPMRLVRRGDIVYRTCRRLPYMTCHCFGLVTAVRAHEAVLASTPSRARSRESRTMGPRSPLTTAISLTQVPCTSLERTVDDVIRSEMLETAVAIADAALRQVAWDPVRRRYDETVAESLRGRASKERISRSPGARGIRQARWVERLR